jgi:hypothetical protein
MRDSFRSSNVSYTEGEPNNFMGRVSAAIEEGAG